MLLIKYITKEIFKENIKEETGMSEVVITTMCMIKDVHNNKVLVQDRVKNWKGISFPGGHVEHGESIMYAVVREVKEETGLDVWDLKPCGIIHWFNDQTGERYLVFNFKTESWSGELLTETEEGKVFWIDIDELLKLNFAKGFYERLPMFLENKYIEGFATWNDKGDSKMKFI